MFPPSASWSATMRRAAISRCRSRRWWAVAYCVVALVYFLTPVDLIPDMVPMIGQLDDAAVILFAVKAAHNDIADYKKWKGL